jgi:membrane associated rhomboid family serine protease
MSDSYEKRDTLPFWWIGRIPVYATTILVLLDLIGMFLTVLLKTAHVDLNTYMFVPQLFWKDWHLWQLVTYPLLSLPSFFYIFGLFFLFSFGVGVETYLGRRVFLRIVALLVLVSPAVCSVWWLFGHFGAVSWGSYHLSIGIFVAYATLYPNVEWWNWITMKWLAFAGIVLSSLMYLPERDWYSLSMLLATCGVAHALVRYERGHWTLPSLRLPRRRPKLRVLPKPSTPPRPMPAVEMADHTADTEVDALLDKIAKSGIASLTPAEKARLEKAREELLKKERR